MMKSVAAPGGVLEFASERTSRKEWAWRLVIPGMGGKWPVFVLF